MDDIMVIGLCAAVIILFAFMFCAAIAMMNDDEDNY